MWIRGTGRLTVVALLGIEITIIALASAASAAARPDGRPATGGPPESWLHHGPDPFGEIAALERIGPAPTEAWALRSLTAAQERLDGVHGPPLGGVVWPLEDMRAPQAAPAPPAAVWEAKQRPPTAQQPARPHEAEQARPPESEVRRPRIRARAVKSRALIRAMRSLARTGVARMPQARPDGLHKRANVDLTRVVPRQAAMPMSHATASGWLKSAGLRTRSTGNCVSRHLHHCTSLDKVRAGTIARAIELKRESRCPIMVTGGTEAGHAPGRYSHGNGYKLDISHNPCIDRYITKNHDGAGTRSDGARLYRSTSGTTFADESDHWDILFR